ncbi:hypothetical protein H257_11720 [Aphanomyces astaci]|uniref:N-acetylgalactosaminide beta-1,3-galactosyltransferase n=1 Tax=Aphanomyces astaci TaxID=112090 RepID=W4G1M3_APHAT|nr:hypothetical protein H257_11720 [Aphanomyces astaci]ETV73602.1 hypothetical protein H257_11720 [Aphanomyces astaci]|eukprot:XP_009837028.1 hypothetical protein H257_11720 [Aphanomyces astaci]
MWRWNHAPIYGVILVALNVLGLVYGQGQDFRYKENAKQYMMADNVTPLERRLGTHLPALQLVSVHTSPEAERVRVLCWVNTFNATHDRARAIKATWGRRCNKLLFMSNVEDATIPTVRVVAPPTHEHLWQKHRFALRLLSREFDAASFDWILKCDDDSYVIIDNLKSLLARHAGTPSEPVLLGHRMTLQPWIMHHAFGDKQHMPLDYRYFLGQVTKATKEQGGLYYTPGGGGYAFNAAYLSAITQVLDEPFCIPNAVVPDDWAVSFCMLHLQVVPQDTRDGVGRERFHQYSPEQVYYWPNDTDVLDRQNWHSDHVGIGWKNGSECCAADSVTFHYVHDMALVEAYLYNT